MEESVHVVNTFEHDMTCLDIFMDQTRIVLSIGVINIFHQTWQ